MQRPKSKEAPLALGPAAAATLFLLMGVGVVWFARKVAGVEDGVVLTALIIVPAVLYLLLRGGSAELRGPGGWAATFVQVAHTTVTASGEKLDVDTDVQVIEKESMSGLTNRISTVDADQPVLMTMSFGRSYSPADVRGYLETLGQFPRFQVVALLDSSGAFLGCISPSGLRGIMRTDPLGSAFLSSLHANNVGEVLRYPGVLKHSLLPSVTNAEALLRLAAENVNSMPVVDENRRLRGVVERDQLVSKLVLSLVDSP